VNPLELCCNRHRRRRGCDEQFAVARSGGGSIKRTAGPRSQESGSEVVSLPNVRVYFKGCGDSEKSVRLKRT
jgi:hypothetical protein